MVEAIAEKKCDAVAGRHPEDVVIGADTVVVFGGKVMGKPKDAAHAVEMLRALAGKRHTVYTAYASATAASRPSGTRSRMSICKR